MERVAVDVMGPFPCTERGNRYVLAMDYLTKWPEAFAIPDQEAETISDILVEEVFSRFGAAVTIHSDQGRNFESRVFAAMCASRDASCGTWPGLRQKNAGPDGVCTHLCQGPAG